uniref:Uncharacterized protein n=1 Tax=Trichogramma kaykai TaxID=54128 RepID=A0ABD2W8Z5_9HYME
MRKVEVALGPGRAGCTVVCSTALAVRRASLSPSSLHTYYLYGAAASSFPDFFTELHCVAVLRSGDYTHLATYSSRKYWRLSIEAILSSRRKRMMSHVVKPVLRLEADHAIVLQNCAHITEAK